MRMYHSLSAGADFDFLTRADFNLLAFPSYDYQVIAGRHPYLDLLALAADVFRDYHPPNMWLCLFNGRRNVGFLRSGQRRVGRTLLQPTILFHCIDPAQLSFVELPELIVDVVSAPTASDAAAL